MKKLRHKEGNVMQKGGFFVLAISLIVFLGFGGAWAEESAQGTQDYQVFDLGEIFVRSDKPPAVQEMAITNEVTEEEITATNSQTVAEALTYVPGIRVSTGRKNEPSIQIHGMPQEKVLVLIDGVPYYETKYGKLDMNQIPVDNIAKIEVTKGAPSVLYGPNALMGVVNIITKKGTEKLAAQATVGGGRNYTNNQSVSHGWKVGMLNYWLNYSHRQTDGWSLSDDFNRKLAYIDAPPGGPAGDYTIYLEDGGYRTNSDYNQHSVWGKIGIDPTEGSEYYINAHFITKEKGDPPNIYGGRDRPFFSQVYDRITNYEDWGVDFSGQQKVFDNFTLKGKVFYHHHTDDYTSYYSDRTYEEVSAVSRYKDYIIGGYLIGDYQPVEWDAIRFAFHYKGDSHHERGDANDPYEKSFSTTGSVALENEFNLIKNLSIVVGLSYDWFDVTQAEEATPDVMDGWGPMIGATYLFPDTTKLFGSIARKTRFPTLNQLYSSNSGNLDLEAETAINYTLGVSRSFSRYAWGELAWFYHDLADFIDRPSNTDPYENYAKIAMTGIELTGEFYPLVDFPLWEDLRLWASYTYNYARDKSVGRVTEKVRNVPAHKVDMGIHFTIPYIKTGLDVVGIYMGDVYSQLPTPAYPTDPIHKCSDYFTMNLRISQVFLKYFEAYVAINNIFDRDYESEYGFPAPGRNVYFGLTAKY